MTRSAIGVWMQKAFAVVKGVGPAFTAMAAVAAAARLIYGMARDHGLPKALAAVDERSRVPRPALLTTAAISVVVSVWAARRHDGLDVLVSVVNMGALAAFTLLHLSVIGYFVVRHHSRRWVPHLVVPAAGAAVSIWIIVSATALAKVIAAIWLVAGAVVFSVSGRRTPAREREHEHI
jgi:amino acid transporter